MASIYALSEPGNPAIPRYSGRTKHNPRQRLHEHLVRAFKAPTLALSKWLISLDQKDQMPCLVVYEIVGDDLAAAREEYWIKFFKPLGLLNLMIGTRQPPGFDIKARRQQWLDQTKATRKRGSAIPKQLGLSFYARRKAFDALNKKQRKAVQSIDGRRFESLSEASRELKVSRQALLQSIKRGWRCKGTIWSFEIQQLTCS